MDPEDYQPDFLFETPMTVGVDDEFDDAHDFDNAHDFDIPTNTFDESY